MMPIPKKKSAHAIAPSENPPAPAPTAESQLELAIEGSGTGVWDRNVVTGRIHYSRGWKALLGYAEADLTDGIEESYTRIHPDDLAYVQAEMQAHFDRRTDSYAVEHRIRCSDGSYKWVCSRGKVIERDEHGQALRMTGTTTDVSEIHALANSLQQSINLITNLTNAIPGMAYHYSVAHDGTAAYCYVSQGIDDIYELTPAQVTGKGALIDARLHPDDLADWQTSLQTCTASLQPWHHDYRVILPRQGHCWRNVHANPSRQADGSTQWHGFITDITERKCLDLELLEFATTDFLTRLPNRRHFMTRMQEELARIHRGQASSAVLMCDLDHFKKINDTHGHAAGDLVLRYFADVLQEQLRKNDTAGRIGGEEFAVVLSGATLASATLFAERIRQHMDSQTVMVAGQPLAVTVSIGIAVMLASDAQVGAVLSRSDSALYRAKEAGRNCIEANWA
ncbi:MAG: diguanylate cyclase (GGDEF)-like protein/PAS domain S-box-containing protein [Burkholderiaceae bacterium]|jgi:diguanylate cyclase (GGDEF)-like protein/PAS domain S-box-containing protein